MASDEPYEHDQEECKKHKEHEEHKEHHKHKEHEECEEQEEHQEDEKHKYEKHESQDGKIESGRKKMSVIEEKGESVKIEGVHLKKRDLWLVAGGALGALAALGLSKFSSKARPAAVGAVREGYAFKEWLAGKAEKVKEDMEDIVAEGVHQYHSGLAATADTVKREKDILEKIEKMVEEKLAKMRPEQGEGE